MNVDNPVPANMAQPASGPAAQGAQNADPDSGFSLDLAQQDPPPAPADDPLENLPAEFSAEDITAHLTRLLQTPGSDNIAPRAFLAGAGAAPPDRVAAQFAPASPTAETLPSAADNPARAHVTRPLNSPVSRTAPAAPAPDNTSAPALIAVPAKAHAPAAHTAAAASLPPETAAQPKPSLPDNATQQQTSASRVEQPHQFASQTRPLPSAQKTPAAPGATPVTRLHLADAALRQAAPETDAPSPHHAEPRSHAPTTSAQHTAITPATANPAAPAVQNIAFSAEPGQLPGLAPVEISALGPAPAPGQPTAAAAPTGPPVQAMHAIAQAAAALQDRPVELTLHPRELGRVRLTLQAGDGTMMVSIAVERPETLDLLRRNIDQLASQLRDIGYQNLKFEFAGQGQQSGDRDQDFDDTSQQAADSGQHTTQTAEPLRLLIGSDAGLDIRV